MASKGRFALVQNSNAPPNPPSINSKQRSFIHLLSAESMEAQEGRKMALRSLDNALPATIERPKKITKVVAPAAKISAPAEVPRGSAMNDENAAPPPKAVEQSLEYIASEDLKALPDPETKIAVK